MGHLGFFFKFCQITPKYPKNVIKIILDENDFEKI